MRQKQKIATSGQFLYLGRWVDKHTFRAFVYNEFEKKLVNSYAEYQAAIESGLWFESPEAVVFSPKDNVKVDILQLKDEKLLLKEVEPKAAPKKRKLADGTNG